MPVEINWLRDYKGGDPEKFREYQRQRFRPVEWVDDVLAVDEKWRNGVQARQDLSKENNKIQKDVIAPKKKAKENCDADLANIAALKKQVCDWRELCVHNTQHPRGLHSRETDPPLAFIAPLTLALNPR